MSDISDTEGEYKCDKCDRVFKHEKSYLKHISNKLNPCDLVCIGCFEKVASRGSWHKHKTLCKDYKRVSEEMKKRESSEYKINAHAINSHNTNNTNNANTNNANTLINNNANMIMLSPYGLDHTYMWKDKKQEEMIGPARGYIIELIRDQKCMEAYEKMFKQMHGNPMLPENHNVYMEDREKDEVYHYRSHRFNLNSADRIVKGLNMAFFKEMRWLINSSELDWNDKDQLVHNLRCYYNYIDLEKDELMRKLLYENRDIVKNTIRNNHVVPNEELIRRYNNNDEIEVKDRITLP